MSICALWTLHIPQASCLSRDWFKATIWPPGEGEECSKERVSLRANSKTDRVRVSAPHCCSAVLPPTPPPPSLLSYLNAARRATTDWGRQPVKRTTVSIFILNRLVSRYLVQQQQHLLLTTRQRAYANMVRRAKRQRWRCKEFSCWWFERHKW